MKSRKEFVIRTPGIKKHDISDHDHFYVMSETDIVGKDTYHTGDHGTQDIRKNGFSFLLR